MMRVMNHLQDLLAEDIIFDIEKGRLCIDHCGLSLAGE